MDRRAQTRRPATVGVAVGDRSLAGRLGSAIVAYPDLAVDDRPGAAEIVVVSVDKAAEFARTEAALVVLGGGYLTAGLDSLEPPPRAILPADADPALVAAAVRLVAYGLYVLPESAVDPGAPVEPEEEDPATPAEAQIQLTPREREVLELLAAGASNKVIARQLEVSVHTAKFHVASLFRKLGASGRLDAVGIGLRTGLLMM